MKTATDIIAILGGPTAVAKETGFPLTTILGWRDANFIPVWRRERLLKMATDTGKALSTADFPTPEQRISRAKAAA